MTILLIHQNDPEKAAVAAAVLEDSGHSARRMSADDLPAKPDQTAATDVIIVLAEIHREKETYALCRRLRQPDALRDIPLLVGVSIYQMPLANRVKKMPNAHFIFTPLKAADLEKRLRALAESSPAANGGTAGEDRKTWKTETDDDRAG